MLLMGLSAGFGLSVLGVLLVDRLDPRVRYPEQVTQQLGLRLLGVVPHAKGANGTPQGIEAIPVIEAMRGIRLNLVHLHGTADPLLLTVTSPGPGEGKSFVTANLALAFAEAGHKTLLVDGDNRRGGLHHVMARARKPGLMDLLTGKASRDEIVQATEYPGLYFVGSGTRTSNAPELLGSAAMAEVVADLRSAERMHVVIVDSPPLAAGVDAFTLGTLTGNLMMVLRMGTSDRELAEAKLDILDRLPVRVLGAVLNDVGEGSTYDYYRYSSYYLEGYEHSDEDVVRERKLLHRAR